MRRTAAADAEMSGTSAVPDFETFFVDHRTPLFRALWLVTRNRHEAEDVAQEAFLKVWERWGSVAVLDDPEGYLYRTAMNLFRNRRRRALLALRRVVRLAPVDDQITVIDDRDQVVRALGRLTPAQRAAIVLTDLAGFTSDQAAKALGIRPSTVRVQAARARAILRDQIGADR